jgi:hypothetical protein
MVIADSSVILQPIAAVLTTSMATIILFVCGSLTGIVCGVRVVCVVSSGLVVTSDRGGRSIHGAIGMVDVPPITVLRVGSMVWKLVVSCSIAMAVHMCIMSIGMWMSTGDDVHVLLLCTPMCKVCWRQDVAFVFPSPPIKVLGAIGCVLLGRYVVAAELLADATCVVCTLSCRSADMQGLGIQSVLRV